VGMSRNKQREDRTTPTCIEIKSGHNLQFALLFHLHVIIF
jgi:hypothetical protein